jgi:hypothetical protein
MSEEILNEARLLRDELTASIDRAQNRDQMIDATAAAMRAARLVTALEDLTPGT